MLTDDVMEDREGGVLLWDLVVGIDDPELARVLEGMHPVAEEVEETAQGPDVCLLIHHLVAVQVYHLRGTVHGSGVTLDLHI